MSNDVSAQAPAKRGDAIKEKVVMRGLNFYYGKTHALKNVDPRSLRGPGDGVHRPVRLRQVDAA